MLQFDAYITILVQNIKQKKIEVMFDNFSLFNEKYYSSGI